MIIPMKKITVIVAENSRNDALEKLRELGVVHVHHVLHPEGNEIDALRGEMARVMAALQVLSLEKPTDGKDSWKGDGLSLANHVNQLVDLRKQLEEELRALRLEAERWAHLGDFDPASIKGLETQGIFIRLCRCSRKQLEDIDSRMTYFVVGCRGKEMTLAIIDREEGVDSPLKGLGLPNHSTEELRSMVGEKEEALRRTVIEINALSSETELLSDTLAGIEKKLEFEQARSGMGKEDPLVYMQGYCPASKAADVKATAFKNCWGLLLENPSESDSPPTLIENPPWINVISPVFKMFNIIPGYREFDISLVFLAFLGVFFAILVGDAGYGALFLLATLYGHFKFRNIPKEPVYLMYFFSTTALVWGSLAGNWFGLESLSGNIFFSKMTVPALDAFSTESQEWVMLICFIIGAIHLSLGHLVLGLRLMNSLKALEQVGWIMIIWGVFFLVCQLVLGFPFPYFAVLMLFGGMTLVVLFTEPGKNVFNRIGLGLANLPMMSINCFSDIVSYIRLFAVGMATFAVAVSFNDMASELGFGTLLTATGSVLILLFGHGLNIIMVALAIIVHGVRLNILEFSGRLGMQWSGFEYKPFNK